ncbi:MAG: FAD binding domain-containing protein [Bauldia sp.]|nr:FAD binding domain-containing protein [Bauldia sp.]
MRDAIRFVRNGRVIELSDLQPDVTLLDYLRLIEGATGTKEGCADGSCGTCTVAVGRPVEDGVAYAPAVACRTLVGQVDAAEIVAIEDIAEDDGTLHPVQAALVESHASQCGFCIPGMAMSLFCLYHATTDQVDRSVAADWIEGNLCRCNGYRPVIDAAIHATAEPRGDRHLRAQPEMAAALRALADGDDIFLGDQKRFLAAPARLETLVALRGSYPDAALLGGGLGRGPLPDQPRIIVTNRVAELQAVEDGDEAVVLGAGLSLAAAMPWLAGIDPDLGATVLRTGGRQWRHAATLAGAIVAGTQAGELPAALLALEARVTLRKGPQERTVAVESFFAEDGRTGLEPGEVIVSITIPRIRPAQAFRCYRVGKRFDFGPATVAGAFRIQTDADGRIDQAFVAFGGLAPAPRRARAAEAALIGARPRDRAAWTTAFAALRDEFTLVGNSRGSARYRIETAQALLGKAMIEIGGTPVRRTRLSGFREAAADVAG